MTELAVTRFGVIRHAETRWNRQKRIQGHGDSPLTRAGEQSAAEWGRRLAHGDWDRILCSDLGRARQTAEAVNRRLGVPVHLERGLREQHWGEWEGRRISDIIDNHPDMVADLEARGWLFRPPGGENRRAVLHRTRHAFVSAARRWPGQKLLVVTHEGVIKCLANGLTGRGFVPGDTQDLKAVHLHWFSVAAGALTLSRLNAMPLDADP